MIDNADDGILITGASGAFGMVDARILAGAGCKLVLVSTGVMDIRTTGLMLSTDSGSKGSLALHPAR